MQLPKTENIMDVLALKPKDRPMGMAPFSSIMGNIDTKKTINSFFKVTIRSIIPIYPQLKYLHLFIIP